MTLYTTLQLGAFHPVFCEDFLFETAINDRWHIAAVFDGCSSGRDSHFAATLLGKTLKMLVKKLPYQYYQDSAFDLDTITIHNLGNVVLKDLFNTVLKSYNLLLMDKEEMMATTLLALFDKQTQEIWIANSGDGLWVINETITIIDQGDYPNYMGYHLDQSAENWIEKEVTIHHFEQVYNWAIASDGVLSFAKNSTQNGDIDVPHYLLVDTTFADTTNMLHKKTICLERDYLLSPNDDVAIVRGIIA